MVKKNAEYKGIQKKLVAAIAMVLVASIMVVTSSYAWFTLSTAPEVTGINTSVGSNGNLEIALRTGSLESISNSDGLTFPAANNYWGNLVDLSNEMYHLDDITLMPAALTAEKVSDADYTFQKNADDKYVTSVVTEDEDGKTTTTTEVINLSNDDAHKLAYAEMGPEDQAKLREQGIQTGYTAPVYNFAKSETSLIKVPTYGADGRISGWNTSSYINPYQNGGFPTEETSAWGVRGIGTTSGLSAAELALLNARKTVSSAKGTALNGATRSLNTDAVKVANIAVKNELEGTGATYEEDVANVRNLLTNLLTITASLEEAVKASVVALGVSQGTTVDQSAVTFTANADGTTYTLNDITGIVWKQDTVEESGTQGEEGYVAAVEGFDYTSYKTMLEEAYAEIKDMNTKISGAREKLEKYEGTTAETPDYAGMVDVLQEIVNPDEILVGGKTISQHDVNSLVGVFMGGSTPVVTITSGLYADIALFVGNYSTPASMYVSGTFSGVTLDQNFTVQIETQVSAPAQGWYLDTTYAWLSGLKATGSDGAAAMMTDLYAYAIDLAFRTNASGSNLLLQTEAKNRVEGSDVTQGAGSFMQFKTTNASFTIQQMANLMSNIRVLFLDTDGTSLPILAVAGLDVDTHRDYIYAADGTTHQYWSVTVEYNKITSVDYTTEITEDEFNDRIGSISLTDEEKAKYWACKQATVMVGTDEMELYVDDLGNYTTSEAGNTAVYDIPNYTIVDLDSKTIRASLVLYNFEFEGVGTIKTTTKMEKQVITSLTQNTAKGITAMVYLDGNNVDNADVAIGGESLTGTLNLQFASDAALDPMDYTFGEKLPTPTAEISSDTLTITPADGDDKTTDFKVSFGSYSIDVSKTEAAAGIDLSATTALADVPAGTYTLEIVAAGQGYVDSEPVEVKWIKEGSSS